MKSLTHRISLVPRNSHTRAQNNERSRRIISFVTDIEGCAGYLDRFVNISRILKHETVTPSFIQHDKNDLFFPYTHQIAFQDDTSILVIGGDLWDRGGSDLYVIRQLLSLQRRHPDRVYFLMGNRDINKMRIIQEMGGFSPNQANNVNNFLPQHPGVYWLRGTGLKGDPLSFDTLENKPELPAERLRWILSKTMGAPEAFELRKRELQQEIAMDGNKRLVVTDDDVVESYMKSCHPSGEMGQYLSKAKLVLRFGSALFVHGALPIVQSTLSAYEGYNKEDSESLPISVRNEMRNRFWSIFFSIAKPWTTTSNAFVGTHLGGLQTWIDFLNDFCRSQVRLWANDVDKYQLQTNCKHSNHSAAATWSRDGGYFNENVLSDLSDDNNQTLHSSHPFGSLMQYGMGWLRDRSKNPTVVYASWLNDGMPRRFMTNNEDAAETVHSNLYAQLVSEFFKDFNIDVIVTGHQPVGDSPFPIQVDDGKFIVCADTSYSGDTHWISHGDTGQHLDRTTTENSFQEKSSHCRSRKNLGRGTSFSGRGDVTASEVLIEMCEETGRVTSISSHGILSDGTAYSSLNFLLDSRIGKILDHNSTAEIVKDKKIGPDWWVKSIFADDNMLLSKGSGYSVYNWLVHLQSSNP